MILHMFLFSYFSRLLERHSLSFILNIGPNSDNLRRSFSNLITCLAIMGESVTNAHTRPGSEKRHDVFDIFDTDSRESHFWGFSPLKTANCNAETCTEPRLGN